MEPETTEPLCCPVCLIEHDDEIHAATRSIHKWLRERISLALRPLTRGKRNKHGINPLNGTMALAPFPQANRKRRRKPAHATA